MDEIREIPNGWALVKLGDLVVDPKKDLVDGPFGSNLKADEYTDSGVPVFRIQNIRANRFVDKRINFVTKEKAKSLARHSFASGDLIITKLGDPLGLCCRVPEKYRYGIIVADLMRLRPNNLLVYDQFLIYAINCNVVQNQFKAITKGTTRPRVNLTIVREIQLPLPPLPEQHRFVAKLEELFSSLDKGIESLKTAQQQLKVYRQAVLKWAFEGKLTSKNVTEGRLPEGWKILRFIDFCKLQRGYDLPLKKISEGNYPVVTSSGVHGYHNEYKANGPCLITGRSGGVGNIHYLDVERYWPHNTVLFVKDFCNNYPKYVYYYFLQFNFKGFSASTTIPTLDRKQLYNESVCLPPISEQYTIVAEIESRLSVCDKIEESIEHSLKKSEALRQSILKKAFKGKLIAQDPNDEPASVLLDRIKAEGEKNKAENPLRRQTRKHRSKKRKS